MNRYLKDWTIPLENTKTQEQEQRRKTLIINAVLLQVIMIFDCHIVWCCVVLVHAYLSLLLVFISNIFFLFFLFFKYYIFVLFYSSHKIKKTFVVAVGGGVCTSSLLTLTPRVLFFFLSAKWKMIKIYQAKLNLTYWWRLQDSTQKYIFHVKII